MRQIKFRGLLQSGSFIYGSYVTDGKDYHAILRENPDDSGQILNTPVIPETVGQFTGIQGKDGVDVYEDDIIESDCYSGGAWFGRSQPRARYAIKYNNNKSRFAFKGTDLQSDDNSMEVIGNIHLNPESIK